MADQLTYEQRLAVEDRGGKLLVSAAAGSGKTKVLVDRLLKYMTDSTAPANIDEFLLITYTKAAAAELRGKIAAKLSEHIAADPGNRHLQRQMQRLYLTKISTVHAFCADLLREFAYRLDIAPDFRVGDENECVQLRTRAMEMILEEAYDCLGEDADLQAFVDTQGLGRNDALVPEIITRVHDSAMCHLNYRTWCDECVNNAAVENLTEPLDTIWGQYLKESLFACLDRHIGAMKRCSADVAAIPGMEKQAALLHDTVQQLEYLRASNTWDEIVQRKNIDYGRLVFPKKVDDPSVTEPVKAVRAACKAALEKKLRCFSDSGSNVLTELSQSTAAARGLMKLVVRFDERYASLKKARRILDFSDLEHRTLDLLLGKQRSGITAISKEIGQRFREIMVDEYQDSNGVQDAIFSALTNERKNLFMVGDVKQSIYQFRLADPGIFLEKYATYLSVENALPGQGRKVSLSSNFRSSAGVIEAVNSVFRDCMSEAVGGLDYGDAEALREGIPHISINEPEVELHCIDVLEDTYGEEAAFVADRILELLDGSHYVRQGDELRPITPEDVVILLRSPGSVGMQFQYALEQRGIPCAGTVSKDMMLTEQIGTLHNLLQVISNPRQDIPLVGVLASPIFSFTADELARIRTANKRGYIYDAIRNSTDAKCADFVKTLDHLRRVAAMGTVSELLEQIFSTTRMDTVYSAMEGGSVRKAELQSFYQLAVDFGAAGSGSLDHFLEHLEVLRERGLPSVNEAAAAGCVTIMSIHKSKGLEFPVVFLCGLSRRFNQEDQRQQVLCHKTLGLGLSCVDRENRVRYPTLSRHAIGDMIASEGLSEELRVLYVAMTRARDRLIMTYASQSLEKDVLDIALRKDISGKELMTSEVSCPGDWILYSALGRTEAGELFQLGAKPAQTEVSKIPWKIAVHEALDTDACQVLEADEAPVTATSMDIDAARALLDFQYTYEGATRAPSKQTATQKKGRLKDQEAAEDAVTREYIRRNWRKPTFLKSEKSGLEYGTATHAVLQYIRYEACEDTAGVKREVDRLVQERYITQEQAELVNCDKIAAFFASELGTKLRVGDQVLREFKFSILDDAAEYGEGLAGEKVLLQGVVDCALVEDDGITIVDFKTDYVTDQTLPDIVSKYRLQVQTYADALSRIYGLPIKGMTLYFFHIDSFCWL